MAALPWRPPAARSEMTPFVPKMHSLRILEPLCPPILTTARADMHPRSHSQMWVPSGVLGDQG